jgi:hypothetical protein
MLEFQILFWLLTKHIIADYFTQYPWMYKYKGIYGHPGGLAHAGWHGLLTTIICYPFVGIWPAVLLGLLDSVIHYHVDYVKSNSWKRWPCTPQDQLFWIIHGVDQYLHGMTYFLILHLVSHGHV